MEKLTWYEEGLSFKCTGCGKCCTGQPGFVFLSREDITRLAKHFELTESAFLQRYAREVDGFYSLKEDPENYDCVLLKDNQCTAYDARPIQCKTYPFWENNLRSPSTWSREKALCEGIDHEEAPLIPKKAIEEQLDLYLDNILEQNFKNP